MDDKQRKQMLNIMRKTGLSIERLTNMACALVRANSMGKISTRQAAENLRTNLGQCNA